MGSGTVYSHKDWGVRADTAPVLQAWLALPDASKFAPGLSMLLAASRQDPDPFVRRVAEPR